MIQSRRRSCSTASRNLTAAPQHVVLAPSRCVVSRQERTCAAAQAHFRSGWVAAPRHTRMTEKIRGAQDFTPWRIFAAMRLQSSSGCGVLRELCWRRHRINIMEREIRTRGAGEVGRASA